MADQDFVTIRGRFGLTVADGTDPGDEPDVIWCDSGRAVLTPKQTWTKIPGGSPVPWSSGQAQYPLPFNSDGYVTNQGNILIKVTDLTSPKVNPQIPEGMATHTLSFVDTMAGDTPVPFPTVSVRLAADTVDPETGLIDLTLAASFPSDGGGTPIIIGPRGTGVVDVVQPSPGELALKLSDGTVTDPIELPVGPGGSDAGVAGYIGTPGSATQTALSAQTRDLAVSRTASTKHAPALGLYFPEAEGAVGNGSANDTAAIQAAIDAAAVNVATGRGGTVILRPDSTYSITGLKMRSNVTLDGVNRACRLAQRDASAEHMISLYDAETVNVAVQNLTLNGRSASQSTANAGIYFTQIGASSPGMLPKHRISNVHIRSVKGIGLYLGEFTRTSVVDGVSIYAADEYGMWLNGADSIVTNVDVAQSGKTGVYVTGAAYVISTIKSWYSGRIDGVGHGFWLSNSAITLGSAHSQENKGNGFYFYREGTVLTGMALTGCISDSDNTAGTTSGDGFSLFNVTHSVIEGVVTQTAGLAGTPARGLNIGGGSTASNDVRLAVRGQSSWVAVGSAIGSSRVDINGREGRVSALTYAASLSFNPWDARTFTVTLGGASTVIANPGVKPRGLALRLIINQSSTAGRAVTFGSDFKVSSSWTPDTAANKTNVIDFICDGTNWIQVGQSLSS